VVSRLRDDVLRWLGVRDQFTQLPEQTQQALLTFADAASPEEADWNIATDALMIGYSLRVAESALPGATTFAEPHLALMHEFASKEPDQVLLAFADDLADDLPAPFGEGKHRWKEISTWGAQRALERDQVRRNAAPEDGDLPSLNLNDCVRVFGLGYCVRYVEEALGTDAQAEATGSTSADTPDEIAQSGHVAQKADCFCGCGRKISRFPLGNRSINDRGRLVAERLGWAKARLGDKIDPDWIALGVYHLTAIQTAMHGDLDPRQLDEDDVRRWQLTGAGLEALDVQRGGTPINTWLSQERQAGRSGRWMPGDPAA
jgi:hypothetical protein